MAATQREAFQGFAEADSILSKLPMLLRGRRISTSINRVMERLAAASAAKTPREGSSVGGIEYTPLRGERAARMRLSQGISNVLRKYNGGETIVGVAGPIKRKVGRHSHLVEFGFHHTTGGTFSRSGGRQRAAKRLTGVKLQQTRWKQRGTNRWGEPKFVAGTYFSQSQLRNISKKFFYQRTYSNNAAKTGQGKRGQYIPGRPFVMNTWQSNKERVHREIIEELRQFAEAFARSEARAAKKAAKIAARG
jgi:hypothetical protein